MSLSCLLLLGALFIHFEATRRTSLLLPSCAPVGALAAHMVEVMLWAHVVFALAAIFGVGAWDGRLGGSFVDDLYCSIVMYMSLAVSKHSTGAFVAMRRY